MSKIILRLILAAALSNCLAAQSFRFGRSKYEITPPPGYPTGGHGPAGDLARGYWNRIWVRAFYIGDSRGHGMVLATCDLSAMPLGLRADVWNHVKGEAAKYHVPPEGLIISATHTHHGPGNYSSTRVYNEFGSRESGFSKPLFEFLSKQIVKAVREAMSLSVDADLNLYHANITSEFKDQFILNRSPRVFELNANRNDILYNLNRDRPWPPLSDDSAQACKQLRWDQEPEDAWDLPDCARLRAVDRRMTVLQAVQKGGSAGSSPAIGTLVFFAVHPTVLAHSAPLYNSDFVGEALDQLESDGTNGSVVGFFNGAEGDVVARRTYRDILEVRDRTRQFHDAIGQVLASTKPQSLDSYVNVGGRVVDMNSHAVSPRILAAEKPAIGVAALGGGELDRSSLYDLGWKEGVHRDAHDGQGPKAPSLDALLLPDIMLTSAVAPPSHFPRYLPVVFAEIGSFQLGALPVEVSTMAAAGIRKVFEQRTKDGDCDRCFQVIGLANEYAQYTCSESEYAAQDYMGASTLWGPREVRFFQGELEEIKASPSPPRFSIPRNVMNPGPPPRSAGIGSLLLSIVGLAPKIPFGPIYVGDIRELPDDGLQEILLNKYHQPERHLPYFEWVEVIPDSDAEFRAAAGRNIVIEKDGKVFDQADTDFIKILRHAPYEAEPQSRRWAVIWIRPLWEQHLDGEYVFHVTTSAGKVFASKPFPVDMSHVQEICSPSPSGAAAGSGSRTSGCLSNAGGKIRRIPRLRNRLNGPSPLLTPVR